nr:MAG TPA: hypothetical protein [Caudoviricetes sp.]
MNLNKISQYISIYRYCCNNNPYLYYFYISHHRYQFISILY